MPIPYASRKQPGMMHPPTGKCLGQYFLRRLMAKQSAGFAGMRKSFEAVGLGQRLDLLDRGRARHQR